MATRALVSGRATEGALLALLAAGGLALAAIVWATDAGALGLGAHALATPVAPLVLVAYLGAHGLRIARTLVVAGDSVRSVRSVATAHAASAAWTGLLPFKAGELARMWALGRSTGGPWQGLRIVWIERTFDAALIGLAALAALVGLPGSADAVVPIALLALALLTATATAVGALPENVGTAKGWIIARYDAAWSLRALHLLDGLGDAVSELRRLVRGKLATLAALTLGIWTLEACGMALLLPGGGALGSRLLVGMLAVLSGVLQPEVGADAWAPIVAAWRVVVFGGAAALGVVAMVVGIGRSGAAVRGR